MMSCYKLKHQSNRGSRHRHWLWAPQLQIVQLGVQIVGLRCCGPCCTLRVGWWLNLLRLVQWRYKHAALNFTRPFLPSSSPGTPLSIWNSHLRHFTCVQHSPFVQGIKLRVDGVSVIRTTSCSWVATIELLAHTHLVSKWHLLLIVMGLNSKKRVLLSTPRSSYPLELNRRILTFENLLKLFRQSSLRQTFRSGTLINFVVYESFC